VLLAIKRWLELVLISMYHSFFLEMYVTDLQTKNTSAEGEPKVINETPATALVDGNNLLGPAVGKFCMNLAIKVC